MWFTALIIGFAGSLHCVGMCSPLALAVTSMKKSVLLNRLLYNSGRIFTYGVFGAIVSSAGVIFQFPEFQNILTIALGIALLIIGFAGVSGVKIPLVTSGLQQFTAFLKSLFSKFLQRKTYASIVFLGALNGLLPCGLTFLALTYCLTLKGPIDGFTFMILFGAGTLPAMFGLTSLINFLINRFHLNIQKVTIGLMIVSGCLLIARVFLIHIPHAPSFEESLIDIVLCHQ